MALAVPTRLGYGVSGFDVDPEVLVGKGCEEWSYSRMVEAHAGQVDATVKYLKKQPWVDARRIVLAGNSVGGFGSVTSAALHPEGVIGVINFVGGAGGSTFDNPCRSAGVGATYAAAGSKTRVPTLWIYVENDKLWGPKIPVTWHRAYASAGGVSEFHMLPPIGDDGHKIFDHGNWHWRPLADAFLARLGIPLPKSTVALPPSGFAPIHDVSKVPLISEKSRQDGYERFLRGDIPRAFVIEPNGGWAFSSGDEKALEKALVRCELGGKRKCKPYAVDDAVVWTP
jgi:dienelactone hydrolase